MPQKEDAKKHHLTPYLISESILTVATTALGVLEVYDQLIA